MRMCNVGLHAVICCILMPDWHSSRHTLSSEQMLSIVTKRQQLYAGKKSPSLAKCTTEQAVVVARAPKEFGKEYRELSKRKGLFY